MVVRDLQVPDVLRGVVVVMAEQPTHRIASDAAGVGASLMIGPDAGLGQRAGSAKPGAAPGAAGI